MDYIVYEIWIIFFISHGKDVHITLLQSLKVLLKRGFQKNPYNTLSTSNDISLISINIFNKNHLWPFFAMIVICCHGELNWCLKITLIVFPWNNTYFLFINSSKVYAIIFIFVGILFLN